MRVKMQYTVNLEEVPEETRRLFSRANGEIRDAGDHMDDIFAFIDSGTDYENILDSIKSISVIHWVLLIKELPLS